MAGLLNGTVGAVIYFAIVLLAMIRLKQVKVPTSVSVKLWREIKFQNNFINYQNYKVQQQQNQGQTIEQDQNNTEIGEKSSMAYPIIRDDFRVFLENTLNKVQPLIASIQEEKEKNF